MGHPQAVLVVVAVLVLIASSFAFVRESSAQDRAPEDRETPQASERGDGQRAQGMSAMRRRRRRQPDASQLIAEAIAPIDEMIRRNGFAFRASHFAEDCRDWSPAGYAYHQAHAARFAFAIEAAGGRVSEYCLCAARGPDGECGLYVSVCNHHVEDVPHEGGGVRHQIVIDDIRLVKPGALSLKLRAELMDELSQGNFLGAYRGHVRAHPDGTPEDAVIRPWLHTGGTEEN